LTRQNAQASNVVVTSTLFVCSQDAHVLFDTGVTHSFVSSCFALRLAKSSSFLDETLVVTTPVGDNLLAKSVYCSRDVSIKGKVLPTDLVVLDMIGFDVILGMNWLSFNYAIVDCHNKVVKFEKPGEATFSFQGERIWVPNNLISSLRANKLLRRGYQAGEEKLENVPIVCEFLDVFP